MNAAQIVWSQPQQWALAAALHKALDCCGRFQASPGGLRISLATGEVALLVRAVNQVFMADIPLSWAVCQLMVAGPGQASLAESSTRADLGPMHWVQVLRKILKDPAVHEATAERLTAPQLLPPEMESITELNDQCLVSYGCRLARLKPSGLEHARLCVSPDEITRLEFQIMQQTLLCLIDLLSERWLTDVRLEQEKLASLKRLAYGASHEINNPLANIATRAQTLLIEETNPRKRQSLETINSQAFRAYDMLANLMHYAAAPPAKFECIDPVAVTRRALVEFASYFPAFPANMLNSRFPDQPLTVEADPLQLAALLHALLRNAHEATGGEGRISLQLSLTTGAAEQSPQIEWTVSDDGPPIDPIAVRFFCDPFHSGREAGRGLGFGLSRALRIVEAHGGHLELIPGVDRGLIARAALPVSVRQHTLRQSE